MEETDVDRLVSQDGGREDVGVRHGNSVSKRLVCVRVMALNGLTAVCSLRVNTSSDPRDDPQAHTSNRK